MGFAWSCAARRLGTQSLENRAARATSTARATELGREKDLRGNVPTAPLRAPQPKARQKTRPPEKQRTLAIVQKKVHTVLQSFGEKMKSLRSQLSFKLRLLNSIEVDNLSRKHKNEMFHELQIRSEAVRGDW